MDTPISLPKKKYTVVDSVKICFRCAPVSATFYGFFDLSSGVIAPFKTLIVARFIDTAIGAAQGSVPLKTVLVNLVIVVAIASFEWLKQALHNFADLALVLGLRENYRTALMEKQTRLAYRHIENGETWDLIQRIAANPEGGRLKLSYFHLIDLAAFVIKVGGLLMILTSAVWWGGIAVIAISALTLIFGIRGGKAQYQAEREASRHDRQSSYFSGVLTNREASSERMLFGFTGWMNRKWIASYTSAFKIRMAAAIKWYIRSYTGNIIALLSWIFIMVVLLPPLLSGDITVGLYIALTQALANLNIVWGFMETVNGIAGDAEFYKDLTAFIGLEERPERSTLITGTSPALVSLELRDIRFRYPGTENYILRGVSYSFEPGRHYALVGANGAGKTTLTRLLTGLYPIDGGEILLNGKPMSDFSHKMLLSFFTIVYQDFARYDITLRENIIFGKASKMRNDVSFWDDLLEKVELTEAADRLPQGLDTPLGKLKESGADLSGGEWQRVAMARALANPAPIRILDEPTAALDPLAESRLYELFDRVTANETTLFISHRLGATKLADTILVLGDGKIVETGSHSKLMKHDGLYREMFEKQRSWYE